MENEQVQMFVSITGASEDVARNKLQAHGGNLNAAIDNFFNEGEPVHPPVQRAETDTAQWMEEDEPSQRQPPVPFPSYPAQSTAARTGGWLTAGRSFDRAPQWIEEENTPQTQPTAPFPYYPLQSNDRLLSAGGSMGPRAPLRDSTPFISHPSNIRQVPLDWRDNEEPTVTRASDLEPENAHLRTQSPTDFVSDDDEVSGPPSTILVAGGDRPHFDGFRSGRDYRNANPTAPLVSEVPAAHNEGADIEEEMIKAAIEASRKDTDFRENQVGGSMDGGGGHSEDDDMAWAVSQSLKTAEEETAMRQRLVNPGFAEEAFLPDNSDDHLHPSTGANYDPQYSWNTPISSRNENINRETASPINSSLPALADAPAARIDLGDPAEDVDELEEQPLLRRRSNRRLTPVFSPPITENAPTTHQGASPSTGMVAYPSSPPQRNGHARQADEWGGLSSEEQDEAVMLEAAMFGSLPEGVTARFRYPSVSGGLVEDMDIADNGGLRNYTRPAPLPPSAAVIAQRLLREQQDDEYLASLEADREKEVRAQLEEDLRRLKEEEAKAAALAELKLRQEEELRKSQAAEELERQLAAKRAALPEEPSVDDETAVTLMVRMPDGSRQGRRFRKSEHLQCLFDFIDVSGGVVPGSYRLVRQYPRKAFTDGEHDSSFHALGLSSKHEVLMLELI